MVDPHDHLDDDRDVVMFVVDPSRKRASNHIIHTTSGEIADALTLAGNKKSSGVPALMPPPP